MRPNDGHEVYLRRDSWFFFLCRGSCWIEIPVPVARGIWPSGFFVAPTQVFDRYLTHWYPLLVISFSSLWACLKKGHLQRHTHTKKKNWWNKKHQKTGHRKKQAIPSCWWSLGPGRCVLRWPASMACEFVARMGLWPIPETQTAQLFLEA